jgi:ankyrin repeat/BTB/POZ domain-containing protein 1
MNPLFSDIKDKPLRRLSHPLILHEAFEALLLYLYTGTVNIGLEHVSSFLLLCKQCQLSTLYDQVQYLYHSEHQQPYSLHTTR